MILMFSFFWRAGKGKGSAVNVPPDEVLRALSMLRAPCAIVAFPLPLCLSLSLLTIFFTVAAFCNKYPKLQLATHTRAMSQLFGKHFRLRKLWKIVDKRQNTWHSVSSPRKMRRKNRAKKNVLTVRVRVEKGGDKVRWSTKIKPNHSLLQQQQQVSSS